MVPGKSMSVKISRKKWFQPANIFNPSQKNDLSLSIIGKFPGSEPDRFLDEYSRS